MPSWWYYWYYVIFWVYIGSEDILFQIYSFIFCRYEIWIPALTKIWECICIDKEAAEVWQSTWSLSLSPCVCDGVRVCIYMLMINFNFDVFVIVSQIFWTDLSILELYILVCMHRLQYKEETSYNFNSVMKDMANPSAPLGHFL
jgi:hypothetical protein